MDKRGFGKHKEVLEQMAAGNDQDQTLLGVLNQLIANEDTTFEYGQGEEEGEESEENNYSEGESDYVSQGQGEEEDEESEEYKNVRSTESSGVCTSSSDIFSDTSGTITEKRDSEYFSATSPYEDQGEGNSQ